MCGGEVRLIKIRLSNGQHFTLSRTKKQCDASASTEFTSYPFGSKINDSLNLPCSCSVGTQICPDKSFHPAPLEAKVSVTDYYHLILFSNVNLCNLWSLKINLTILLDIYQHPTALQMSSGDVLIDLTSRNVSQWLLKTREDFYKRRYGGFEFGIKSPLANIDNGQLGDILLRFDKATNLGESRLNFFTRQFVLGRIGKIQECCC